MDILRVFQNFLTQAPCLMPSPVIKGRQKNQPSFGAGCLSIIEMSLGNDAEKYVCYL